MFNIFRNKVKEAARRLETQTVNAGRDRIFVAGALQSPPVLAIAQPEKEADLFTNRLTPATPASETQNSAA